MRQFDRFQFEDVRWRAELRDFHDLGFDVRNAGGGIVAAWSRPRRRRETRPRSN